MSALAVVALALLCLIVLVGLGFLLVALVEEMRAEHRDGGGS